MTLAPEDPYVASIRDILKGWRAMTPAAQGTVKWELSVRALRSLLRQDKVFAAHPVITIHAIDPANDRGDEAVSPALTAEHLDALPEETWIEIRLTVPTRTLPAAEPAQVP